MAQSVLSEQQRQTAFQRLLSVLPSASARLVTYGAVAGAIYSLYPNDPAGLMIASPILANLVAAIGGDVLASMIEKVASKNDPSPEEIVELLEQTLANTQIATVLIQNLPTKRELYRVISLLDERQDNRLLQLTQQNEVLRALLEQVLDELRRLQKTELDNQPAIDEQASLETYLNWVRGQYNTMRVLSMTRPVPLDEMYTNVYVLDKPSYWRRDETETLQAKFISRSQFRNEKRQLGIDVLVETNRLFIVGEPGTGKTTFLRYLALQAARKQLPFAKIPIYVELKRLASSPDSLFDLLVKEFSLGGFSQAQGYVEKLLRQGNGLVLLDGLDEVVAEKRVAVHVQIDELVKLCGDSHMIITCRPHAGKHHLERFTYVEVGDFTPDQVERFVGNWFGADKTTSRNLLRDLAKQEYKNIRELARTPLLLALLCMAYAEAGTFPQQRDQLYSQAVQVVMEQWDEERGVQRDSVYGQLTLAHKHALLSHVAYRTFAEGHYFIPRALLERHIQDGIRLLRQQAIEQQRAEYGQVLELTRLPPPDVRADWVTSDIAAQHGLLVTQMQDVYSFSHLTLHEYFTARYIVESREREPMERLMQHVGDDRWREVFLLTAGMLFDATGFAEQYLVALTHIARQEPAIVGLLRWSVAKSEQVRNDVNLLATRAFFIYLARSLDLILVLDLDLNLNPDSAHAHIRDLNFARTLARDLDLLRMLALDLPLAFPDPASVLSLDLVLESDFAYYLADALTLILVLDLCISLDLALLANLPNRVVDSIDYLKTWSRRLKLSDVWKSLDVLTVPNENASAEAWQSFNGDMEHVLMTQWGLEQFWEFTETQVELLTKYLEATKLLVECLQVAYVPDRERIENRLLLPSKYNNGSD